MLCLVKELLFSVDEYTHYASIYHFFRCQSPFSILQPKKVLRISIPTC